MKLTCEHCDGKGWYWRVPERYNPFAASIEVTARAMFKVTCTCEVGRSALTDGAPS